MSVSAILTVFSNRMASFFSDCKINNQQRKRIEMKTWDSARLLHFWKRHPNFGVLRIWNSFKSFILLSHFLKIVRGKYITALLRNTWQLKMTFNSTLSFSTGRARFKKEMLHKTSSPKFPVQSKKYHWRLIHVQIIRIIMVKSATRPFNKMFRFRMMIYQILLNNIRLRLNGNSL